MQLVAHGKLHEVVPRAMKLDLVDPMAVAVVRAQPRRVLVGLKAPADGVAAPRGADLAAALERPAAALARQRLDERDVVVEEVASFERRRLV